MMWLKMEDFMLEGINQTIIIIQSFIVIISGCRHSALIFILSTTKRFIMKVEWIIELNVQTYIFYR